MRITIKKSKDGKTAVFRGRLEREGKLLVVTSMWFHEVSTEEEFVKNLQAMFPETEIVSR